MDFIGWINAERIIQLLKGLGVTYQLTFLGAVLGILIGIILALLRLFKSNNKIISFIIDEYIDIFRGTPLIIQLFIFSLIIFPKLPVYVSAFITLGLNSGAYVAEIMRAGIQSLDKGQMEAAKALGMPDMIAFKEVTLPQAIKNVLPALLNEFVVLFKETAVVGYLGEVVDLTKASKQIQANTYNAMPYLIAGLIYYVNVKLIAALVKRLERRLKSSD